VRGETETPSPTPSRFEVAEDIRIRLDAYVAQQLSLSRTRVGDLIAAGAVRINGCPARKSYRPRAGDLIEVVVPPPEPMSIEPEDIPIDIVFEDDDLLVVDKPYGLVVHPAPGHRSGTLVNALLHHVDSLSGAGDATRPGIVHRLDRDTSGLLVVAKNDAAHRRLSTELADRKVTRGYVAATWGHIDDREMTIDRPVGRDPRDRKRMAVVDGGRKAVTHVRVIERWTSADLLAIRLETGRTHQIRVHLRSLGHPVVGDPVYGAGWERGLTGAGGRWAEELARRSGRLFLHAARLGFTHPVTGEAMAFSAPLPETLSEAVDWARASA
jgi:23S rRNA pseudouridine1911/1915/1917 synthase